MRLKVLSVCLVAGFLLGIVLTAFPVSVQYNDGVARLVIGNTVAAQDADYTCDGVNDDVQFQDAIDALNTTGGMIYVLAGTYSFSDTVTRAIDGVSIVGLGGATVFVCDNATPLFEAGGDRWLFSNLWTDGGGLAMGVTVDWCWLNVGVDDVLYSVLTSAGGVGSMELHSNEWHTVAFATESSVSAMNGTLNTAVGNIAALQSNLTALNSTVKGLSDSVSWTNGNLSALNSTVIAIQSDLSSVNSTVVALNSTMVGLQGDFVTLNSTVYGLNASVYSINATMVAHIAGTYGVHGGVVGDNDGDTKIQTQESADEDIIRMDVNGVESFVLSSLGVLTLAKQSVVIAYANVSQAIVTSTLTKISLNNVLYDVQGEFNTTNYRYTAKNAGYYLVFSYIRWAAIPASGRILNDLFKNGALYQSCETWAVATSYQNTDLGTLMWLSAGDYVELYAYQSLGQNCSTFVDLYLTKICVLKLS